MGIPRIDLAETSDFDLGGMRVSPARRQVSMAGECRELEPKVAQVLIALASASPAVVSRDRLVEQCWDGRIVGDDALNRCIVALRHLAKQFSPEPFAIETVPRVGYSLVAGPGGGSADRTPRIPSRNLLHALLLAAIVAVGVGILWLRSERADAAPASIAVLPFRNLSSGDAYFAQGVSEEILGQLTREPGFRVAGPASTAELIAETDERKIGRALGVDYILEGTVRPGRDNVRISAALVRTRDGTRLWSETYDRELDDILEIQSAIGQAVANGLRVKLIHRESGKPRPINGKAYALYLNARGLLRSDNPQSGEDAVAILREAIRLDGQFAPAWAGLAQALYLDGRTKGAEGLITVIPEALDAAHRALRLDPNLAAAHGALADLLGPASPEAEAHLRRAAALEPRTGEGLMRLATAQMISGQFPDRLATVQRAHRLDPVWPRPLRALVDLTAIGGDRRAAESLIRREFAGDESVQNFALARVAWLLGDYSEAARRWSLVAKGQSRWSGPSQLSLDDTLFMLKLAKEAPSRPPLPTIGPNRFIMPVRAMKPPSARDWQQRNRSAAAALVYEDENIVAAKRMLAARRARELVATFDSPTGLLGIRRGKHVNIEYVRNAAIAALALRNVGRAAEADALLNEAATTLRATYAHGNVPIVFDDDAAAIWALQGKRDQAVSALNRALSRGWVHAGRTDLPNVADEPALQSLRGYAPFETLRLKYAAHFAREREQTARDLKLRS